MLCRAHLEGLHGLLLSLHCLPEGQNWGQKPWLLPLALCCTHVAGSRDLRKLGHPAAVRPPQPLNWNCCSLWVSMTTLDRLSESRILLPYSRPHALSAGTPRRVLADAALRLTFRSSADLQHDGLLNKTLLDLNLVCVGFGCFLGLFVSRNKGARPW